MIDHLDINEINPHAALLRAESHISSAERRWENWTAAVERILGHSLDGDQQADGYSLDFAYDAFERRTSAATYAARVIAARKN